MLLQPKHGRMMRLQHLAIPQINVHTAGQAWIEASDGPHNINAFEVLRTVFLEDRRVLYCVFIRAGRAEAVARVCVPGGWRIRVIVGDAPRHRLSHVHGVADRSALQ